MDVGGAQRHTSDFEHWAANNVTKSKQSRRVFAKWRDTGTIQTSVRIGNGSRQPGVHVSITVPFPPEVLRLEEYHNYSDGKDWYEWVCAYIFEREPGMLTTSGQAKHRRIRYESGSGYIKSMLRAFAHFWSGHLPPMRSGGDHSLLPEAPLSDDDTAAALTEPPLPLAQRPVTDAAAPFEPLIPENAGESGPDARPRTITVGTGRRTLRISPRTLCRGTFVMGDPGSGKTFMVKHFLECLMAQSPTITSYVVFDWKGDLRQLAAASLANDFPDVQFCTYTFGREADSVCTPATLDPFDLVDRLMAVDLSGSLSGQRTFIDLSERFANELLEGLGFVSTNTKGEHTLECRTLPTATERRTSHGLNSRDSCDIAESAIVVVKAALYKDLLHKRVPHNYEDVKAMLVRYAEEVPMTTLQRTDIERLCVEIDARLAFYSAESLLYRPDDVRLTPHTFFDPSTRTDGRRVKVSVVALGLSFGDGADADTKKRKVMRVVCKRILTDASRYGTDDARPHAMIVFDEAGAYMNKNAASLVDTVKDIVKVHRDKGIGVVISTQRPGDVHFSVRSVVGGVSLVGKFNAQQRERCALVNDIVKNDAVRKAVKARIGTLGNHEFLGVTTETTSVPVEVRAPGALKRVHESSAHWNRG